MNKNSLLLVSALLFAAWDMRAADAPSTPSAPAASGPYHFVKEIHLGGLPSTDYLTVDSENHRLYVSHGTAVTVVDLDKDEVIGDITGFTAVHGIAIAPKLGLGYITDGRGNKVSIFDLKTQKVTKTVDTGNNPDWVMFEASTNEVYVCNGSSKTITAFDAVSGNVTATIDIGGGRPETAMVDPKAGRLFDNLEDKFSMAVIDLKTHKMVENWPAVAGKGASGLAIDLEHHKLFLACADDAAPATDILAMMDSATGKVVATLPCAKGVDSSAFDPATQYAFAPGGGSGTITIAKEDGDKLTLVQTLTTATGAKTMAIDPTTHKIYVACVKYQAPSTVAAAASAASGSSGPAAASASGSARGAAARAPRPAPVADSFRVLVYGMDAAK
ncbi:MAG TPA: hypothetical protein VK737_00705 [Opitutales bacterium]|jgi:YVTN family beta-propeller protein|nr:hypothetical protein [Opitutales bacterium]